MLIFGQTPLPIANFRHVFAMFVDVGFVVQQLVAKILFGVSGPRTQTWHPIDHVADQVETVQFIQRTAICRLNPSPSLNGKLIRGDVLLFQPNEVSLLILLAMKVMTLLSVRDK